MRTLKITVTDENGILLDFGTINVSDVCRTIAVVPLNSDQELPISEMDLLIGAPEREEVQPCRPSRRRK